MSFVLSGDPHGHAYSLLQSVKLKKGKLPPSIQSVNDNVAAKPAPVRKDCGVHGESDIYCATNMAAMG